MFKNRKEAGKELAKELEIYKTENPLILAIARGGVEIGYYIAQLLECEWTVIITRKLAYPNYPEAAFGAVAEDRSLYFNPRVQEKLSKEVIEQAIRKEEREIQRRIHTYRNGLPLPHLKERTIILVDDGIATGATLLASIKTCKKALAAKIIVASPVASMEVTEQISGIVDDVIVLETPQYFFAVSQAYQNFKNLNDKEVLNFLQLDKSSHKNKLTKAGLH